MVSEYRFYYSLYHGAEKNSLAVKFVVWTHSQKSGSKEVRRGHCWIIFVFTSLYNRPAASIFSRSHSENSHIIISLMICCRSPLVLFFDLPRVDDSQYKGNHSSLLVIVSKLVMWKSSQLLGE